MKILISNVYSWKNKGDAAIILSMIEHIKTEFPSASISISSIDANDKGKYSEEKLEISFLTLIKKLYSKKNHSFFNRVQYILTCYFLKKKLDIFSLFAQRKIYLFSLFPQELRNKIESYKSYDLVIAAGGGYFISKGPKNKLESYFNHDEQVLFAYDFYLANAFNKPFILYNQSIGPFFNEQDLKNLIPFLKKAEAIICRETLTYNRLNNIGLKNLILSEDIAFNLTPKKNEILKKYGYIDNDLNLGFTVRKCLPSSLQQKYEKEVSLFIQDILKSKNNAKVYFMPQVTYEEGGDNDLYVVKNIYNLIDSSLRERVITIDEDIHPSDLKYMIAQMDYFFGTRMHSCIFALASNVKTIALSYEPKTDGIMKSLKMNKYFINVKDVTAIKLYDLYEKISKDEDYYITLDREVSRVRKESLVNLKNILENK